MNQHPSSARFHEILAELGERHDRKQADYGRSHDPFANVRASEEWGMPGWNMPIVVPPRKYSAYLTVI